MEYVLELRSFIVALLLVLVIEKYMVSVAMFHPTPLQQGNKKCCS